MRAVIHEQDQVVVARLKGRLALGDGVEHLRPLIRDLARRRKGPVLDLEKVTEIDTSGLAELIEGRAALAERGGELKLVRPPKHVARLLRLTRLDRLFETFQVRTRRPSRPVLLFENAA